MASTLFSSQPFGEAVAVAVETKPASSMVWHQFLVASWRNSRERSNCNAHRDCGTKAGDLSLLSKARGCLLRHKKRTTRHKLRRTRSPFSPFSPPKAGRLPDAAAPTRRRGGANRPRRWRFFDRESCPAPRKALAKLHHGWLSKILPSKDDDLPWPPLHHLLRLLIRFPQSQRIHDSSQGFFTGCHCSQSGGLNWPSHAHKMGHGISSSLFYMVWSWWQQSRKPTLRHKNSQNYETIWEPYEKWHMSMKQRLRQEIALEVTQSPLVSFVIF